jgi:hypothetical protein
MSEKYALFIYDRCTNSLTFAQAGTCKKDLLDWAQQKFAEHLWFVVYKFSSNEFLFGSRVAATKWNLDYKVAGKTAKLRCECYLPMETAYRITDNPHEWFFKTF